ncbi:hypothetical protein BRX43_03185 [Sphingomonas sp. S-NIH.Pt15_0812]|nr:hypothetical protein BRX43_03185 [Sphingomonas sp. S-NIH.Pt15_0812]
MDSQSNNEPKQFAAAPRCQARTRSGKSCRSAAVHGKRVCRMHGGMSPGAPKGEAHGRWRNGAWTLEARQLRADAKRLLAIVEGLVP